jgi:hypothetical protein
MELVDDVDAVEIDEFLGGPESVPESEERPGGGDEDVEVLADVEAAGIDDTCRWRRSQTKGRRTWRCSLMWWDAWGRAKRWAWPIRVCRAKRIGARRSGGRTMRTIDKARASSIREQRFDEPSGLKYSVFVRHAT